MAPTAILQYLFIMYKVKIYAEMDYLSFADLDNITVTVYETSLVGFLNWFMKKFVCGLKKTALLQSM